MINRYDVIRIEATKPWEQLTPIEVLKYANYNKIPTSMSHRQEVERTYRREYDRRISDRIMSSDRAFQASEELEASLATA